MAELLSYAQRAIDEHGSGGSPFLIMPLETDSDTRHVWLLFSGGLDGWASRFLSSMRAAKIRGAALCTHVGDDKWVVTAEPMAELGHAFEYSSASFTGNCNKAVSLERVLGGCVN